MCIRFNELYFECVEGRKPSTPKRLFEVLDSLLKTSLNHVVCKEIEKQNTNYMMLALSHFVINSLQLFIRNVERQQDG